MRLASHLYLAVGRRLGSWLRCFRGQEGATTAEYALLLALVVIVLISTLSELGGVLQGKLEDIITELQGAGQ